ncbi:MAG: hypothetical protein KatS3mg005_2273 [Bryobacteraceae bacterium]|jgi:hypothetical protein|nr:MAG: hypothetical protein KatS3mg005_2273 [Bryobacteraceae bacterium]
MSEREVPLPPASFEFLVLSLRMQAEVQLAPPKEGEAGDRETGPDLRLARHFIDLLAMLQEKTKGNLSLEEQRLLDNTVTELRFRYLYAYEAEQKKAARASASNE